MRRQLFNFIYGVLDYAAYPIGMLIVAPLILRNLGVAQYGIWTVTASVVNIGSVVASGFGDAATQRIASRISSGQQLEVRRVVRAAMGIHLVLALLGATSIWLLAPALADRLAMHDLALFFIMGIHGGSVSRLPESISSLVNATWKCVTIVLYPGNGL